MLHLDVDRGVLEGTDSYMLAAIPVEVEDGDVTGLVPTEAVAAWLKSKHHPSLKCGESEITLEEHGSTQSWARTANGTFPNLPALIPHEGTLSDFRVRLDAKRLYELSLALGATDGVTLSFVRSKPERVGYFPSNMRPIVVNAGSGASALLMPIRIPS